MKWFGFGPLHLHVKCRPVLPVWSIDLVRNPATFPKLNVSIDFRPRLEKIWGHNEICVNLTMNFFFMTINYTNFLTRNITINSFCIQVCISMYFFFFKPKVVLVFASGLFDLPGNNYLFIYLFSV